MRLDRTAAAALRPAPPRPAPHRAARRLLAAGVALGAAAAIAVVVFAATYGVRTADSDEATLRGFQIRVLSISQAAAENRMAGALAAIQALESDLDAAARDGRISAPRLRGIESALEAVRSDLTIQLTSAAAAPSVTAQDTAGTSTADTVQQEALPVQAVSPEPAPAPPAPAPVNQAPVLPDAAKDNGRGKGKDKP